MLHIGLVSYGNIGSPDRLDFTVIGKAVNLFSRLEAIAKMKACPTVATHEFVQVTGREAASLGRFQLKGIQGEQEVSSLT